MTSRLIEHVFAALRAAGPDGLTARAIADAVSQTFGRPVSRERILTTIGQHRRVTQTGPRLHPVSTGQTKHWTLVDDVADPAPLLPPEDEPAAPERPPVAWPSSVTAALMGDPLPGRSAYDRRCGGDRHA